MKKNYLMAGWYLKAFVSRHGKTIGLSIIFSLIVSLTGFFLLRFTDLFTTTQHIGYVGSYQFHNLPDDILNQLSFGLTSINDQQIVARAAKNWKISPDGKTYTFQLKTNLTWHDGSPFTTKDINYNIQDVKTKILDDYTIQFILKTPFAPFVSQITTRPLFKTNLVGLGEYQLKSHSTRGYGIRSLDLVPNNHIKTTHKRLPIHYNFYPTESEAKLAFKLGNVSKLVNLENVADLQNNKTISIEKNLDSRSYIGLFFNTTSPLLSSKAQRQALSYLVPDRPNDEKRALGPISPNSAYFYPNVKRYDYNPKAAKRLTKDQQLDTQSKKLEILTTDSLIHVADNIAQSWTAAGYPTDVGLLTFPVQDYQIVLIGQKIPFDPDQYSFWHSTQNSNITHLNSPKIDKLLEDGRTTINPKIRKQIYDEFQKTLLEEAPVAFLFHPVKFTVQRN